MILASLGDARPETVLDVLGRWALLALVVGAAVAFVRARWAARDLRAVRPGVPVDEWRRRGLVVQRRERPVVELQAGQRCPICHDDHRPTNDAVCCEACGTLSHVRCLLEVGRCPTLGCAGAPRRVDVVAPAPAPDRARTNRA
jgi:hypothetical protein